MSNSSSYSVFSDSKNHYEILDGLRGVAALMVIVFHLFETVSGGNHLTQIINHGYLAVDFFFFFSGFVIGYAYDDRWGNMTLGGFFKRRLIRLHPMIIAAMVTGAAGYYFSSSPILFPQISSTPVWELLLIMIIGMTLLPVPPSLDIRGWAEMHPLNGPAWSLFFEYVANLLYGLIVRRFPVWLLSVFVALSGLALIRFAVFGPNGDVIGGWSLDPVQFQVGLTRLLYPFFAGLLLSRIVKPGRLRHAFLWCSAAIILIFSIPRVGDADTLWMNGLYDSLAIIVLFPLIVWLGASGKPEGPVQQKIIRFLGDISYPVYILHYPLIYIFTAWVVDNQVPMEAAWLQALAVFFGSVGLAWVVLNFYDLPVRKWLATQFLRRSN